MTNPTERPEERVLPVTKPCGCGPELNPARHKARCGKPTTQELHVDLDIRPLPLCDDCYLLCWMHDSLTLEQAFVKSKRETT